MIETMQGTCDISKLDDGYLVTSTPDFKNMPSWTRQEMKLTKDYKPIWVHIYDNNNDVAVKIGFSKECSALALILASLSFGFLGILLLII